MLFTGMGYMRYLTETVLSCSPETGESFSTWPHKEKDRKRKRWGKQVSATNAPTKCSVPTSISVDVPSIELTYGCVQGYYISTHLESTIFHVVCL